MSDHQQRDEKVHAEECLEWLVSQAKVGVYHTGHGDTMDVDNNAEVVRKYFQHLTRGTVPTSG